MDWMILPFKRFAEFSGRSRRKEFWMFALLNLIVYAVIFALMSMTGAFSMENLAAADPNDPFAIYGMMFSGIGLLLVLWWLIVLIPSISVGVRRLHDRNMSGWWYLGFIVASIIPVVGFIASIAFLVIMLLDGTPGTNRFGPDPKGRGGSDPEVFA